MSNDMQEAAPAGWYPDPSGHLALREWDGIAWTIHVKDMPPPAAPMAAPPVSPPTFPSPTGPAQNPLPPPSSFLSVDNTFAWVLAFAPLIMILLEGVLVSFGVGGKIPLWSFALAVGFNIALADADSDRVRAAGVGISSALAMFLVPVYLFVRQARLRQSYAIPIIWCVSLLVSLGGAGIVANTVGVQMNVGFIESQITSGYLSQKSIAVTTKCPSSIAARIGTSFQCVVTDTSTRENSIVDVTVQNSAGEIVWKSR